MSVGATRCSWLNADRRPGALGNIRLLSKPYRKEDIARVIRDVLDNRTSR